MLRKLGIERRTFLKGTGATIVGSMLSGVGGAREREGSNAMQGDSEHPSLVAHRGFAGLYPENTLAAMRESAKGSSDRTADRIRADMVEIDVMPSQDGTVMVFHDDELGRLTDVSEDRADQLFWETPTEKLQQMSVLGTNQTIPTLREVMEAIPSEVGVNIEFKNPGSEDLRFAEKLSEEDLSTQEDIWREFTQNTLSVASEYDNDVLVSSFYEAALSTVRDENSDVSVAFLFWGSIEDGLDITERYDCEALHPPRNMIQGTSMFKQEYYDGQEPDTFADVDLLQRAHDQDRTVNVWTLDSWRQARELRQAGADGIIADYDGLQRLDALEMQEN
jgi:glycerophosphoryl diester phosphodiesterase